MDSTVSNPMIELQRTRRSVAPRLLNDPAPSESELETMLTVAARVPDHGRLVPWRFIVLDRDGAARLGEVIAQTYAADHPDADAERLTVERTRLTQAPLVVAVVSRAAPHEKIPEWEQVLSAGMATMNLITAANALGYATNLYTQWYAYDRRVMDALGLAPHERLVGFVHVGTAEERPADRARPALDEIVTRY
jgi:nitroreductase